MLKSLIILATLLDKNIKLRAL